MTAAPAGIAVYGWDGTKVEGLVQWVDYDGKLGPRWTHPGNVGVGGVGAHADGSVTLGFSIFGQATLYGRSFTGPAVDGASNVPGLLVAAQVSADGTLRWLRVIAEGGEHPSAAWGLIAAPEGRGGLWWDRAASGVRDGGLVLWDRDGSGSWRAPLRSVQAAAIDSNGGLILLGGEHESRAPGDRGGNVALGDSPQVLERWERGSSTRREICQNACVRHPQLATDRRGRHYLLAQLGGQRFLDWPLASPDSWLLSAFDGARALGCTSLSASSARLLVGGNGALFVIAEAIDSVASVNGRVVGGENESSLLRFELDLD
jgi:hypothetical protein